MGSGSTLLEAYKLGRYWIGMDNSEHSINVFKEQYNSVPNNLYCEKDYEYHLGG